MRRRGFTLIEEKNLSRVVVLSHELWVSAFSASPTILGQPIKLSGELYTVIGVLPAGTDFPFVASSEIELWTTPVADAIGKNGPLQQRGRQR